MYINGNLCDWNRKIVALDQWYENHDYEITSADFRDIEIKFLNKLPDDTKLNQQGEIVEDLLLVIDRIMIDQVDLTNKLHKISLLQDHQGKIYRTFNYITFNGSYKIKIHRNLLYTEWLASFL